jgi:hypothetical protein
MFKMFKLNKKRVGPLSLVLLAVIPLMAALAPPQPVEAQTPPELNGQFYFTKAPTQIENDEEGILGPDGRTYSWCTASPARFRTDCSDSNSATIIFNDGDFPPIADTVGRVFGQFVLGSINESIYVNNSPSQYSEGTGGSSESECSGLSVLGWVLCPITTGFLRFIENIFNGVIVANLIVSPLDNSSDADAADAAIYEIWNNFRIIANVLFVVVLLIAIFGQGLAGFELFSAYDFRKILPRLAAGVVGIQLSWYIVGFMVDLFNVIGAGTRGLILAPVEGLQSFDYDFGALADFVSVLLAGTAVWVAAFAGFNIAGVLLLVPSILLPIALALIMALVVVMFRKMLIFILIVVSPVAFVLGILPNTQMFFKQWWEFFWKALFMYPIIMAFIAGGELTAKLLVAGDESSATNQILGMVALFAPYFLITSTFRLAGSALGAAAGGLQNVGGGIKEKVLGDARDPYSIRARRRQSFQNARRERVTEFMDRNRAGTPASLRSPRSIVKAARAGWNRESKSRKVPGGGRKIPFTGGKTMPQRAKIPGKARLAGVAGGLAAAAMARVGGVNVDDRWSEANARGLEWATQMGNYDAGVLFATLGMTETPDGQELTADQINQSRRHAANPNDVIGAATALLLWSRDDKTQQAIREQIGSLEQFSPEVRTRIWDDATNNGAVKALHPNLNATALYNDPNTGGPQIRMSKLPDYFEKSLGRLDENGVMQIGEGAWAMYTDARNQLEAEMAKTDPKDFELFKDMSPQERAFALGELRDKADKFYDQVYNFTEKDVLYRDSSAMEQQLRRVTDTSTGDVQYLHVNDVAKDPKYSTNAYQVENFPFIEFLSDVRRGQNGAKDAAYKYIYDQYNLGPGGKGLLDPTEAGITDAERHDRRVAIMTEQMTKGFGESVGGWQGRREYLRKTLPLKPIGP